MVSKALFKNLSRLGFPLLEIDEEFDVIETLAEVVRSKDARLWDGFPVILANAGEQHTFDYSLVMAKMDKGEDRENLKTLLLLSLALYRYYHLSFTWTAELKKRFSQGELASLDRIRNCLAHGEVVELNGWHFDAGRLMGTFNNYFEKDAEKTRQMKERHEEMSLEYALSQLFSPKQKELFKKKLEGELLSKTEREYYSRAVKKKVSALANPELHRLAQKLMKF